MLHVAFRTITAGALVALVSACSTGAYLSSKTALGDRESIGRKNPRQALIFASDAGNSVRRPGFCAYALAGTNQTPLWCVTGTPLNAAAGMTVDGSGNLYLAARGHVYEYDSPSASGAPSGPSFTYDDALAS